MQRVRAEREAAGYHFMTEAEMEAHMEAHLQWLRDDEERQGEHRQDSTFSE